ncbi:MAG: hypothetical protein M3540_01270 [Actinomycetota bacterium]|nr:hypothetical protein [Actinomycetota bacterium]
MRSKGILLGAVIAAGLIPGVAYASCIPMTAAQQRASAHVIFEGRALESATATGVQRFRVTRYLKGSGPQVVRVATGERRYAGGGGVVTSVSLHVLRGERWRIYARGSARRILQTSLCDGSKRIARR